MPISIDPQPGENEVECARCGAYFHMELTRCPNCGVNVYEPEDEIEGEGAIAYPSTVSSRRGFWARIKAFTRRLLGKEDLVQALFSASMEQIELYDALLRKVGGDVEVADQLIAFEGQHSPQASRSQCIRRAIQRWERDNR